MRAASLLPLALSLALVSGVAAQSSELDRIFDDPLLARALVGVRIESLGAAGEGATRLLYARNSNRLVMPASNMKLHTLAVAAERLGWDFRYETRLETTGAIDRGTLTGDLIVVGSGDPSIVSLDHEPAPVFREFAAALWDAGIRRVNGRLIGDDRAFADEPLGAGWAWDYLDANYAAPSGALSYNENVFSLRITPGTSAGAPVQVESQPEGVDVAVVNELTTVAVGSGSRIDLSRLPGDARVMLRGTLPAGSAVVSRTTTVESPTRFLLGGLWAALKERGIVVSGEALPIGAMPAPPSDSGRRVLATHQSRPLSSLAGYFMKVSQNFYAETLLKTVGHVAGRTGSVAEGRRLARETFGAWGIPSDAFVMNDGSGLSRYDYTTADTVVTLLTHVWRDPRLRGPFVAALPVSGHDGTLQSRMRGTALDGRVEAKTGSIENVRALSGFVDTASGEKIVFSIIINNFTAPATQIDAIVEKALAVLVN